MSDRHCWLQITSGRGPAECQLAVVRLAEKIVVDAHKNGFQAETIEIQKGENKGTALSALLSLTGAGCEEYARQWQGSILWICQSPFRPNHRRKNWFVGVEMLKPLRNEEVIIRSDDIVIETFRASGPGGQHVNTTDSAVRVKHRPSGLVVVSSAERSQIMNRKLAIARLAEKLARQQDQQEKDARKDQWTLHNNLQRGDAVKIFEGTGFMEVRGCPE